MIKIVVAVILDLAFVAIESLVGGSDHFYTRTYLMPIKHHSLEYIELALLQSTHTVFIFIFTSLKYDAPNARPIDLPMVMGDRNLK